MSDTDGYLSWVALYVKPRHEKTIAVNLESKGHQVFLPLFTRRYDSGKKAELPLFPSYVFCHVDTTRLLPVMMVPGVFSVVGNGSEPIPIPNEEIDRVKKFTQSGFGAQPWPYVSPGQEVKLVSGPLRGVTGVVVDTRSNKWLVVSINLLQRSIAVRIERDAVDRG